MKPTSSSLGKDAAGHGYVLEDQSGRYPPTESARVAISLYRTLSSTRRIFSVEAAAQWQVALASCSEPDLLVVSARSALNALRARLLLRDSRDQSRRHRQIRALDFRNDIAEYRRNIAGV